MSLPAPARHWAAMPVVFGAIILAAGLTSAGASASATPASNSPGLTQRMYSPSDPYNPAYHHPYRVGVVPTLARLALMRRWAIQHPHAVPAASSSDLKFGGGVDGIGVTTGPEKVYLVFWGSQWGTQGTNGQGDVTLSGDPNGMAPYLQELFKGLGTGNELWSGVMTQYCQGVAVGASSCPASNTQHVAYPTGGALAGVWVDESAAAPAAASPAQLGSEAVKAATHFGNTTAASNRNAQYDVVSPTGVNPDHYKTKGFCAWHDWNGDVGVTSPDGDIAFTNMPYVTDVGAGCGENFINPGSAGILDGVSIVNGHEYAETITDQNPAGGWTNSKGEENGDLCAWDTGPGAPAGNLTLTTGTFAMQSTWANDGGGTCEFSHPIVTNGGSGNSIVNGGFETGTFSGWTTGGAVTSIVSSGQHSGSFAARAGSTSPTNGPSNINQVFTAKGGTLTFWYNVTCPDVVSHDWATATLTNNTTSTTKRILAKTCVAHSGWKQVNASLIVGDTYKLTLTNRDDNVAGNATHTLFDDVSTH